MREEVERDVKVVHGDLQALLTAGLLDPTMNGKVVFPYDAVHVDFTLRAEARAAYCEEGSFFQPPS